VCVSLLQEVGTDCPRLCPWIFFSSLLVFRLFAPLSSLLLLKRTFGSSIFCELESVQPIFFAVKFRNNER
jgi:hypothetical protein